MKLAALYSVYNGEELLQGSINQIYSQVDLIVICYQTISNKGQVRDELEEKLKSFAVNKVEVLKFTPDLNLSTKQNERNKHQLMIDFVKGRITHFFMAACDHYYLPDHLEFAKRKAKELEFDVSVTKMYTYYKYPEWQLEPMEEYYMPFICKLYPHTKITRDKYSVLTDPSVIIEPYTQFHIFNHEDCVLHHYSMIRQDIRNKFTNAAASVNWKDKIDIFVNEYENYDVTLNPGIKYFQGRKIKQVENFFGI